VLSNRHDNTRNVDSKLESRVLVGLREGIATPEIEAQATRAYTQEPIGTCRSSLEPPATLPKPRKPIAEIMLVI
jgi:hypothetical protein